MGAFPWQVWVNLGPRRWTATSSKYPWALPALTVDAEGAAVHADCFCCLGGGMAALAAPNSSGLPQMIFPREGAG